MKKLLAAFLILVVAFALLQKYVVATRFNLFNSGMIRASETKEEAIKRGVYVCDVRISPDAKYNNKPLYLNVEEGWIEKTWRSGFWYWTTVDYDDGYTIKMKSRENEGFKSKLNINSRRETDWGNEGLWYHQGAFGGKINLPKSDTIQYWLLEDDNMNFHPQNIAGELKVVLIK